MPSLKLFNLNAYISIVLKKNALLGFLFILTSFIQASSGNPSPGKINGIIIDSVDRTPVEYATIALYRHNETEIMNGTTSDSVGKFLILSKVPKGTYRIVIDFLGYQRKIIDNITINDKVPSAFLGTIILSPKATTLEGVTVTAEEKHHREQD